MVEERKKRDDFDEKEIKDNIEDSISQLVNEKFKKNEENPTISLNVLNKLIPIFAILITVGTLLYSYFSQITKYETKFVELSMRQETLLENLKDLEKQHYVDKNDKSHSEKSIIIIESMIKDIQRQLNENKEKLERIEGYLDRNRFFSSRK